MSTFFVYSAIIKNMMNLNEDKIVIIKGAGDLASAVALRLYRLATT